MAKKRKRARTLRGVWAEFPVSSTKVCRINPDGPGNNRVRLADVKDCASKCSSHWFEPGSMRFFKTGLPETAYVDGLGGAYFITSEKGPSGPRAFSVRHYAKCSINTIGEFQGYKTSAAATKAAKQLAGARRKALR